MLALSIASRPFDQLLAPLAYGQVAPVPFLWAERAMVVWFGINEWALRALPILAGIALCLAIVPVSRRLLRSDEVMAALVLATFSHALIRYSVEIKSYSWDALLAVAMVGAATPLVDRMDDGRSWARLTVIGGIAALSSLTSPFVCIGVGLALGIGAFGQRRMDLMARVGVVALVWGTLFMAPYLLFYRQAASAPYMRRYWEGSFLVPGSPGLLARAGGAVVEVSRAIDAGWTLLGLTTVVVGLVCLGAVSLWRRRGAPLVFLLLAPGLAPFAASAAGAYPLATRLILFAAPLFIMLMAVGVMAVARSVHHILPAARPRWIAAALLLPAVTTAIASTFYPRDQQIRPLVQKLERQWLVGDAVYVFHRVVPAWLFHSTNWVAPDAAQLAWAMQVSGPGGVGHENGPSRGPRPAGEGSDLLYDREGHPVLLGTSSGVQGRPMFGQWPNRPDEGWAASEAWRMRAASPVVWIMVGNAAHEGVDLGQILLDAAEKIGGRLVFQDSLHDGRLYALDFRSSQR
jgi:hypothetical protein